MLPLSVLDLAMVRDGASSGEALAETTEFAQAAERLGYTRIWVAEHHNMATVASTTPAVLMAHLAASTESIRVGSGGVMLPNHAPLAIAEQFALLEAMHPGRIDLGVGRAPGTDGGTAMALRGARAAESEDFPRNLIDVMGMLGDRRRETGLWDQFKATPVAESSPAIVPLGSSQFSAELAGLLGLPFGFAHHFDMGGTVEACEIYRSSFRPSGVLAEPYTIVTASTLAAETDEHATWLSGPARLRRFGLRTGRLVPMLTPEDAVEHPFWQMASEMRVGSLVGTAERVVEGMHVLAEETGADELMLHTSAYDLTDRIDSIERIAAAWR
ncbi:MAG: LLM class flavin-dependent oxidoreductase [Actinomycetota bacterium]